MASNSKCSLCKDDLLEPKLLPCLHSYCEACLNDYVRLHLDSHQVTCPDCREEVKIPEGGVRDLPDNYLPSGRKLYCSQHKNMKPKFYCRCCERVVCSDCVIVGHKDHVVVGCHDDKLREEKTEGVVILEEELKKIHKGFCARDFDIETKICEINEQRDSTVDEIDRRVGKMVAEVEKLGKEMKEKVELVRKTQINKLSKAKDQNHTWKKTAERGVTLSRLALSEETPLSVLSFESCMKNVAEDLGSKNLSIPEIKHSYIYSPQRQINFDLLKTEIGDLQLLPERTFLVTFNSKDVTSETVTWTANPYVIGCLPWYIGCMKTKNGKLGIYLKLNEGEYKTLTTCNASFSLKLVNNKNGDRSITIQEDFPKTFLAGGVGGWEFIEWRRVTTTSGFLDEKGYFAVRATLRIYRLDTK